MNVGLRIAIAGLVSMLAACGGTAAPSAAPASSAAAKPASVAAPASASAKPAASASAKPIASAKPAASAGGALQKIHVGLAVANTFEFEPANIVVSQGLDKQQGIESDVNGFNGDAALQQALAAGSVDVGLASSTASATAITKGSPIIIVAQIDDTPKFMTIIASGGITSVDQLKGKKIGVTSHGAFTEYIVQRLGISKGWGANGIEAVALGGFPQQVAALKQKQTDGFVWTADGGLQMEQEGLGKMIFHANELLPDLPFEVVIAQQKLVKGNPQAVKSYLTALFEGIKFMKANKAKAVELFSKDMQVPADIAAKVYDDDINAMSSTGQISVKGMENLAQAITETKAVDKPPDPKTLYDSSFLGTK